MQENRELIVIIISLVGGVFSILASIFNWDFFFENRKAAFFMKIFGRKGCRIFYTFFGIGLIFLGIKIYIDTLL
jgi:small neutral amino acid transporter SnatA (MarC family)